MVAALLKTQRLGLARGGEQRTGLGLAFALFIFRVAIGHDPGPGLDWNLLQNFLQLEDQCFPEGTLHRTGN